MQGNVSRLENLIMAAVLIRHGMFKQIKLLMFYQLIQLCFRKRLRDIVYNTIQHAKSLIFNH